MELTVVGYYGGSQKGTAATSSYIIKSDEGAVLIDCGAGSFSKLSQVINVDTIDNIIISHYHYDHFSDIGALIYNRLIKMGIGKISNPLSIYTQEDGVISTTLDLGKSVNLNFINERSNLNLFGMRFDFLVTQHPIKCLAVRIRKDHKTIVYTADSAFSEDLVTFALDADLLITENSLYNDIDGSSSGHMNTSDTARLINEANVNKAVLTHLPIYGNHTDILTQVNNQTEVEVILASEFLKVKV